MKIFIDAGHGGNDPGAVNPRLGLQEADLALEIGQALSIILKSRGHNVKNTRQTREETPVPSSKNRDLAARAAMANSFGADCFISIHLNGYSSELANGFEIFRAAVAGNEAEQLGVNIVQELIKMIPDLKVRKNTNGGVVKQAGFAVLRLTNMPAVLIECGFISNDKEAIQLSKTEYQNTFATAIAAGLESWYGS